MQRTHNMTTVQRMGGVPALAFAAVLAGLLVALQWYSPHVQLCRAPMNQVLIAKQVPAARQVPACATALSFYLSWLACRPTLHARQSWQPS